MWKSLEGYVIILLKGRNTDRMLERLRNNGIVVRNAERVSPVELRLTVCRKDFFRLRPLLKGTGCRVRIRRRAGAPFLLVRLWRRKALWIGLILCVAAWSVMPSRVLEIRVSGCETVPESVVLRALEAQGVRRFYPLPDTELVVISTYARAYDERIAWIGLKKVGAVLEVSVVERGERVTTLDEDTVCDVVAVKDGVITSVEVYEGNALVKPGDVVRAGDVLIEGVFFPKTNEIVLEPLSVHARGEVTANVVYSTSYAQDATTEDIVDTGRTADYMLVSLWGIRLAERGAVFDAYEVRECETEAFTDCMLPITLVRGVCCEIAAGERTLSIAERRGNAAAEAERIAMLKIPKDAAILRKSVSMREADGILTASIAIVTNETIGLEKELTY